MQRTIESIAKRRVKNADRKAKKREIERASLTIEEYNMKNQQRITLHRRKKQLEKYILTVTETWKIKSPAEQRRIQQLQKFKVPMDCVNIILAFVNPNMMYLLFKMTAQMKQIRLTNHFDHCLAHLSTMDVTTLVNNFKEEGKLHYLIDRRRPRSHGDEDSFLYSNWGLNSDKPAVFYNKELYNVICQYNFVKSYSGLTDIKLFKGVNGWHGLVSSFPNSIDTDLIIKQLLFEHLQNTMSCLTQYSESDQFNDYTRCLNRIMLLRRK